MKRPLCPLCGSKITNLSITTGNRLKTNGVRVTAVELGQHRLSATCVKGCQINALAAPPKVTQIKLVKKRRRAIPVGHRAKSSGALKAGWR